MKKLLLKVVEFQGNRLFVVFYLLISTLIVYASGNSSDYYAKLSISVHTESTGSGVVYVNESGTSTQTKSTTTSGGEVSFTISATPDGNSYLDSWKTLSGTVTVSGNSAKMSASTVADDDSKATTASIAAVFHKIVGVGTNSNFTIVHTQGGRTTVSIPITVHDGTESLTPTPASADFFECSTVKNDDSGENWTLNITVLPEAQDKQSQTITLRTAAGAENTITFTIKEVQVITLLGAQNGTYDAVQTSLSQTHSLSTSTDTIPVEIKTTDAFAFKFNFTPAAGYRLNRLRVTVDGEDSYLYDDIDDAIYTISHTFTDGATVQPEFIPTNYAQFIVLGTDTTIHYNDLDRAISVAQTQTSATKVVAVYKKGTAKDVNGVILPKPASGEYNIPADVTLLVPGTADYKYVLGYLGANDLTTTHVSSCWRKLIVESGTTINVKGNICVFTIPSSTQRYSGQPNAYGQIHLSGESHIVAESGAKVYVYGYITGDPTKSSVTIKDGAEAFEVFQFTDWRGGSAMLTGGLLQDSKEKEVLPISQYYVQNIETLLKIKKGGKLNLTTGVTMSTSNLPVSAVLVNEMDEVNNSEVQGLFCLGDGSEFHKYYDGVNDRQILTVVGTKSNAKAKFSFIEVAISGEYTVDIPIIGSTDIPVNEKINSRDYVLPVSSNMDIKVDNLNLILPYKVAFMPGTSFTVAENASFTIQNKVYLYDAELNVQPKDTTKGYFGNVSNALLPLVYTAFHNGAPNKKIEGKDRSIRLEEKTRYPKELQDAKFDINGTLTMEGNGALYTTIYDADKIIGVTDTSDEVLNSIFGANITSSEGGGTINYNALGSKEVTYQIDQEGTTVEGFPEIPVHNARLRNADGTFAGGEDAKQGETYMYFKEEGMWYVPSVGIPTWSNNDFNITLPKDTIQNVLCPVVVHGVTITGMTVSVSGEQFALEGDFLYNVDIDSLIIPIRYSYSGTHNEGNPNTGSITITINYNDPLLGAQIKPITIPLSAIENYKPNFSVAIVGAAGDTTFVEDGTTYNISGYVNKSTIVSVVIIPAKNNVAQSLAKWEKSVTGSSFTFNDTKSQLTYTPTSQGTATGELTFTASYGGASTEFNIQLNGSASLSVSSLAFISELVNGRTIYQGEVIDSILANMGNTKNITFTIDDAETHELLSIEPYKGNYRLTANIVNNITEPRDVTIKVEQDADDVMLGGTKEISLTVMPAVVWNWANLYFGSTTTTCPVDVEGADWTLTKTVDVDKLITLDTDPNNVYKATVGTPTDVTQTYTAVFVFKQGDYTKEFTSNIFADPRIVNYCVDNERTYNAVTLGANTTVNVTFNERVVSFASTAEKTSSWTIELKGVPDKLTFTPLVSENAWRIDEYNGTSWTTTYALDNIVANKPFSHSLLPNTLQIRITYAAGAVSTGKLSDVCVTKLENVKANTDKVYMPIAKDIDGVVVPTTRKLVLYSVNPADLTISFSSDNIESDVSTLPAKIGAYTRKEVTLTNVGNSEETVYLYVKNGETTLLTLPICPFEFRQGLPIDLAEDDAERYYFLTTPSTSDTWANTMANVVWDQENRAIVFQNPGVINANRSVTIAFEGAADYIQFHTSSKVVLTEWTIEESANGESWSSVDTLKKTINNDMGIRQELHYTTRYVRITYASQDLSKLLVTNLKLEGTPHLIANPMSMTLNDDEDNQGNIGLLTLTAINLEEIRVESDDPTNFKIIYDENNLQNQVTKFIANKTIYPQALGTNKVGNIQLGIAWQMINTIDDATITIYNNKNDSILAVIDVLGAKGLLTKGNAKQTGLYTGIPDGKSDFNGDGVIDAKDKFTYHGKAYDDYQYHEVDLTNTFAADGTAMFDYLFVYGQTTTNDRTNNITAPGKNGNLVPSNASTPCYVYKKTINQSGKYVAYKFVGAIESNAPEKVAIKDPVTQENIISKDTTTFINVQDSLRIYMTGFAPYATTGYTKQEEGVWFFRGKHGAKLDVYLEDCHIISRNKTEHGNAFYGDKEGGATFSERFARGSGGVLVFENIESVENVQDANPFKVSIHTMGNNLLKSNYGCFYILLSSMKAYQISAPIHVHMASESHVRSSKTTLNFDDLWPKAVDANNKITETKRTNGYLGLKKQSNNAPSIDLGNPYTEVNFNGGQIELQNAQIVSENYKTTLAISYRSGFYGGDDLGIQLAYGIGTDSVGGTVNFKDGTITVEPMWVKEGYKQYYLLDTMPDGSNIRRNVGTESKPIYEYQTSCLRCPKNTYVYGGSVCFLRACQHVTSKGGAPKDGPNGKFLGQYVYTLQEGDVLDATTQLVQKIAFPRNVDGLYDYYASHSYTYGTNSITHDENNKLYFWIPDGYGGVTAEQDKFMSIWKACMTEIRAGLGGVVEGGIGGDTPIEPNEEVKYFLYCKIDDNIHNVIAAKEDNDITYAYKAPVEVPSVASDYFEGAKYTKISPTYVSDTTEYQVLSDTSYTITDKVYYVTTATADIWQTFTAPFDVKKIYVVETYSESELEKKGTRREIIMEQAKHNADFAAFFAVAMAIGTNKSFDQIYESYINWAKIEDDSLYTKGSDYSLRGKYPLTPLTIDYIDSIDTQPKDTITNWYEANFFLYRNAGNWNISGDDMDGVVFHPRWEMLQTSEVTDILLRKGETYSMLFPYCVGCESSLNKRGYWDYWSGKFLIFEGVDGPQTINGRNFLDTVAANIATAGEVVGDSLVVTGNSTFAFLSANSTNVYVYSTGAPAIGNETFVQRYEDDETDVISPTTAFLYGYVPTNVEGAQAYSISRTGQIKYRPTSEGGGDDLGTGGYVPTINGGSDIFVTSNAEGINIAVAEPQYVGVFAANGTLLFNGWVEKSVNVALVSKGVYVVVGENNSVKVIY